MNKKINISYYDSFTSKKQFFSIKINYQLNMSTINDKRLLTLYNKNISGYYYEYCKQCGKVIEDSKKESQLKT